MTDIALAPRRRPLWRLFIAPVLLLIAAAAWSAFWFYAASQVDVTADAWRAREARSDRGGPPSMMVNWSKARASVVGLPATLQRASIVFDDPEIDRVNSSVQAPLARAKHIELHGRLAEGSPADHPVIETVFRIEGGSLQDVHPLLTEPFNADVRTMLSGLKDFSPKPCPDRFREIQPAGRHVE